MVERREVRFEEGMKVDRPKSKCCEGEEVSHDVDDETETGSLHLVHRD